MAKLIFNKEKIKDIDEFKKLCPFGAIVEENGDGALPISDQVDFDQGSDQRGRQTKLGI